MFRIDNASDDHSSAFQVAHSPRARSCNVTASHSRNPAVKMETRGQMDKDAVRFVNRLGDNADDDGCRGQG